MQKKYNLLIPIAGKGNRMIEGGHKLPKPMIVAGDKTILEWGTDSIDKSECNLIFVIRQDHIMNFSIDAFLKEKYGEDITLVITDKDTRGSVESCCLAEQYINTDLPLIVFCPDVAFRPVFKPTHEEFRYEGFTLTFKANSTNYSYVLTGEDGFVQQVAEKVIISQKANVGLYLFKSGKLFINLAKHMIEGDLKTKNEFYIAPLYNQIINLGKVISRDVDDMYILGTPNELEFFKEVIWPYYLPRSFILCSDHSGFKTKEKIKSVLKSSGIQYIDCGCYSSKDCDYVEFVEMAVEAQKQNTGSLILASCRSGQGIHMCANKFKDVRAVLVSDKKSASLGIKHNAGNFFAIPEVGQPNIKDIIDVLYTEKFEGGRHQNRLQKIRNLI